MFPTFQTKLCSVLALTTACIASAASANVISFADLYTLPSLSGAPRMARHNSAGGAALLSPRLFSIAQPAGVDLTVPGTFSTALYGGDGVSQVGAAADTSGGPSRARLWSGSAVSSVLLHSAAYASSYAYGVSGGKQVGVGTVSGSDRALLWAGTSASVVDLHPPAYTDSAALDTDGAQQGGYAIAPVAGPPRFHAMIWSGSAASAVDLHPAGYQVSAINAVGNGQQVGRVSPQSSFGLLFKPMVWNGTAASAVDLTPANFTGGDALDTNGVRQVGYLMGANQTAFMWEGSAASAVNLHSYLSADYHTSVAGAIVGNTIYGYAIRNNGETHIVSWTIVPDPTSASVCLAATFGYRRRRH